MPGLIRAPSASAGCSFGPLEPVRLTKNTFAKGCFPAPSRYLMPKVPSECRPSNETHIIIILVNFCRLPVSS